MPEQVEAVVIGGGQAGLAIRYYRPQQGRTHVGWSRPPTSRLPAAWAMGLLHPRDSNWSVRLPGFPYQGGNPDGFMARVDVVPPPGAVTPQLPGPSTLRGAGHGRRLGAGGQGYCVGHGGRCPLRITPTVVVATGSFQFPKPSPSVAPCPPRSSTALQPLPQPQCAATRGGAVIGSADSGCQIAEELNERRRQVGPGRGGQRHNGAAPVRGKDSLF